MSLQADIAYKRSRYELRSFEAAAFNALRMYVPNYYKEASDSTAWGRQLRGVARLFAQADYQNAYAAVAYNPVYLTPADLLRQLQDSLCLTRNYPGTTMLDTALQSMILKLREAYRLGATTESIRRVLEAYTGQSYTLIELFKEIPNRRDNSIRHTLEIGVPTGTSVGVAQDATQIRDLIRNLYTAIDLAKPAHVGIDLTTVMKDNVETVSLNVQEYFSVHICMVEEEPMDPMLTLAPVQTTVDQHTGLGPRLTNFTYQWYQDGNPITGATHADLVLTSVSLLNTGKRIQVKVTDANLGVCWSEYASLTVSPTGTNPLPTPQHSMPSDKPVSSTVSITTQPISRSVVEGADASFSVTAIGKVVPGKLSPHLNRVWEIQEDISLTLDLD